MERVYCVEECEKYPLHLFFSVDDQLDFHIERLPSAGPIRVYHDTSTEEPINKRIEVGTFDRVLKQLVESGFLKYAPFLEMTHGSDVKLYTLELQCGGFQKTVTYDSGTKLDESFQHAIHELKLLARIPAKASSESQ